MRQRTRVVPLWDETTSTNAAFLLRQWSAPLPLTAPCHGLQAPARGWAGARQSRAPWVTVVMSEEAQLASRHVSRNENNETKTKKGVMTTPLHITTVTPHLFGCAVIRM